MEIGMPSQTGQMLRCAPYFPVADVDQAVAYYQAVLGFECEYSAGKPGQFAIVSRDGFALMFRLVSAREQIFPNEKQGGTWDAFFWVRDVVALHNELGARGAQIVYGPIFQEAYQMDEFAVRDPEGYVLGFGQGRNPAAAQ
jgi:catechol 2,3-dioxygenase-like lactoylglutathione lyase family enzyme